MATAMTKLEMGMFSALLHLYIDVLLDLYIMSTVTLGHSIGIIRSIYM